MHQILERYRERRRDPSLRPDGALPVEYDYFGFPRADLIEPVAGKETGECPCRPSPPRAGAGGRG